jgi:hypothetical protein
MVETKSKSHPPPALSTYLMISGYSAGFRKRIWRYVLAALIIGFIIFCEIRKQSSFLEHESLDLQGKPLRSKSKYESKEKNGEPFRNGVNTALQPIVGKVTISFGEPDAVYERAIRSHEQHNKKMEYPQFVLKERVLSGLWSKHAYIISILVQELAKPEDQRLRWLMFVSFQAIFYIN